MADLMTAAQGLGASYTITLRDSAGEPYTAYTGDEDLTGSVRTGRDAEPLWTLTPTWLDADAGTITLPIAGSDTADVEPGRYLVQLALADGSADLFEGSLEVTYSAGTAEALATYGSFADMLDVAPNIEKFQKDTDYAGFAKQRNKARLWFEDLLHRHYRGGSGLPTDSRFGDVIWYYRDGSRSTELQGWLDDDLLSVTQPVIDAVTYHAVAQIYERQSMTVKDGADFAAMARRFYSRAENAALSITAEIDSDDDGNTDVVIRLGVADTLEG